MQSFREVYRFHKPGPAEGPQKMMDFTRWPAYKKIMAMRRRSPAEHPSP
jgi:hypothetical protein